MENRRSTLLPSLIFGVVLGVIVATVFFHSSVPNSSDRPATERPATPRLTPVKATPTISGGALLEDERNTIQVFEQFSSSVVFIINKAVRRDFFSLDVFEVKQGSGSGFVWDDNGHIVTNFHVVQNGNAWSVTLNDNSTYDADLVGVEPSKDIAVVRVNAPRSKLHPVSVGSSDDLLVGMKVIAIGNPFGLDQTLTTGVVSALGREIQSVTQRTIQGVIQTDAAINPGNSGGPLLNSRGELIGINTAIYSTSGSSAGIGFAVPVNTVSSVVPQLIKYGKVIRPGLGVEILQDYHARRLGIEGVIIGRVPEGSAADRAGLRGLSQNRLGQLVLGDVIVGVNGKEVTNLDELSNELEKYQIGEVVTVKVMRNDTEKSVQVRLQKLE